MAGSVVGIKVRVTVCPMETWGAKELRNLTLRLRRRTIDVSLTEALVLTAKESQHGMRRCRLPAPGIAFRKDGALLGREQS